MTTKNITPDVLPLKLARKESDLEKIIDDDDEPTTVRYPLNKRKIYQPLVLEDIFDEK